MALGQSLVVWFGLGVGGALVVLAVGFWLGRVTR